MQMLERNICALNWVLISAKLSQARFNLYPLKSYTRHFNLFYVFRGSRLSKPWFCKSTLVAVARDTINSFFSEQDGEVVCGFERSSRLRISCVE